MLAAVAAALAAFIWLYEVEGEAARQQRARDEQRMFPALEASEVAWVEFETADGVPVRAEREGGRWQLVRPVAFPADPVTLDALASGLADLTWEGQIEAGQPAAIYGLGDAARKVDFGTTEERHTLRMGNPTPLGGNTYIARGEGEGVFTVPTWRTNAFVKPLLDLRDRRVLAFDESSVRRLELRWPGGAPVGIVRTEDGWQLIEPLETPADGARVDRLLSDLAYLRADDFVDVPTPDAEAAFDPPDFELTLTLAPPGGGEPGRTLRFALAQADEQGRRLARGSHPTRYVVVAERIDDFPRELVAYRERQLAAFVPSEAERVEVWLVREATAEVPGASRERVELLRNDLAWTSRPALREGVAGDWVTTLSDLEADTVLAESMGEEERAGLGLQPPRVQIRVTGRSPADGAEPPRLAELTLGDFDPAQGIVAARPDRPEVFRLAPAVAERLPVDYEAFVDRFAVPAAQTREAAGADSPASAHDSRRAIRDERGASGGGGSGSAGGGGALPLE